MPRPLTTPCLLLVALAVAACASAPGAAPSSGPPTPDGSVSPSDEASGAASTAPGSAAPVWLPEWAGDEVPDAVAERRPLTFCGLERAPAPQPGEYIDRAVRLCFWEAYQAGAEAEFASVQSTMEGATFATIYRATADGAVEVLTDFSQDPFGSGGWQTQTCRNLVEGEGQSLLAVADCGEPTPLE